MLFIIIRLFIKNRLIRRLKQFDNNTYNLFNHKNSIKLLNNIHLKIIERLYKLYFQQVWPTYIQARV